MKKEHIQSDSSSEEIQSWAGLLRWASQVALAVKNVSANAGDAGLIPGLRRFPQRRTQ